MRDTVRRLARIVSVAVLTLAAVPCAMAGTAHAATTIPQHCTRMATGTDPAFSSLVGAAGITVPSNAAGGTGCTNAPNGDSTVNMCASDTGGGLFSIGQPPEGHTCP
ncbi:hypothetical protein ACFY1P_25085 [Streptomyces sp. NPDC001407]|uniref:hypothetical protein n=1 Tax=unclassified Streptomyces TaxID=2593676 RepID=UPI0036B3E459